MRVVCRHSDLNVLTEIVEESSVPCFLLCFFSCDHLVVLQPLTILFQDNFYFYIFCYWCCQFFFFFLSETIIYCESLSSAFFRLFASAI